MDHKQIEESVKQSLKIYASMAIADDTEFEEAVKVINSLDVSRTVEKVAKYLDKNVGAATLQEINEFLNSSRYQEYLNKIDSASALIAEDIKTYTSFVIGSKDQSKLN